MCVCVCPWRQVDPVALLRAMLLSSTANLFSSVPGELSVGQLRLARLERAVTVTAINDLSVSSVSDEGVRE
jgi:hypothetical protein